MSIIQRLVVAPPWFRRAIIALLVALSCVAAFAAVRYSFADPSLAAWWPAAGFAVAAGMLAHPRGRWVVVLLVVVATAIGNLFAGREVLFAVLLGAGNAVEVAVMATLLSPRGEPLRLASLTTAGRFIVVATVGAASAGLALGTIATVALQRPWVETVAQLTASHASATLVMLPVVLVPLVDGRPFRRVELIVQSGVLVGLVLLVFWPGNDWPIASVPLMAFLWAALRFPLIVAASQLLVTAAAVIVLTTIGGGPFAAVNGDTRTPVVLIQIFLLVYAVAALLIVGARTDWFQLIRRLEAQQEALRLGIATADAGIVILDRTGGTTSAVAINPRAREVLGAELPPYGISALDEAIASEATARADFVRDGHVFEAVVAESTTRGGAALVSIVITDVTERDERERLAHEVTDELRRLNDQKDDFISAVSHELRTPVTSIIGFSENLLDDRMPSDLAESGEIIARNARRLADVIEDVLELSRLSALGGPLPPPADIDLVRLARECAEDAQGMALGRRVTVEVADDAPESLVIRSRERDLVRVCANLFSNAVKFSPDGAVVTIGLARSDDGGAIVHVIDHGVGIPPQYRDLVWERFARAPIESHRLVPGTGLGLPIVKALLESRLGGSARLLDTPGGGTTVEVVLPAVAPAVSSPHTVV